VTTTIVMRLLIATLKGGPGKTTTAILLAVALARKGLSVVVICADTRTRGATDWVQESERLGYTVPFKLAIWHPEKDGSLLDYATKIERATGAHAVMIDTGGEQPEAFAYGCLYADHLICPVGPMTGELRRIVETYRNAAAISAKSPLQISVLLTRCPQRGRGKALTARQDLTSDLRDSDGNPDPDKPYALGLRVLSTEITRAVAYDEFNCTIPDDVGEYDELADELLLDVKV
jgi:CobQ/CobB/MinD/ParA family nucleotide binding protein